MRKPLKKVPGVVQLPGGITLRGVPFKVVDYNLDGSPKTFEILPRNVDTDRVEKPVWWLFADEDAIRTPVPEEKR